MRCHPVTTGVASLRQCLALMLKLTISAVGQARSGTARLASDCIYCFSLKERHFLEKAALPTTLFPFPRVVMTFFLITFYDNYVMLLHYNVRSYFHAVMISITHQSPEPGE